MIPDAALTLVVVLLLAGTHLLARRMLFLRPTPRSAWLSTAGGVSVAYVFVHLLPELAEHQESFRHLSPAKGWFVAIERHTYLIALLGLLAFYGLEQLARRSASQQDRAGRQKRPSLRAFWLHLASFAAYNVLIGYLLLHREESDLRGLLIYAVAMALHFLVNDHGLRESHGEAYHDLGRWVLALAPVLGWMFGLWVDLSAMTIAALFAFLSGGIVMNVLKEELPEERQSRFWAFAVGAGLYSCLLLLTAGR